MAKHSFNFFDYVKAAFNRKIKLPVLGFFALNKMFIGLSVVLGLKNPGFWFLGFAIESIYLWVVAGNPNFQKIIQGENLEKNKEQWSTRQARLVRSLDRASQNRYRGLLENCASISRNTRDNDILSSVGQIGNVSLNQLIMMFLKLLNSRINIKRTIEESPLQHIEKEIATLTAALLGPVSTVLLKMENNSAGAGMGTSGLVGQFNAIAVMGIESWPQVLIMHVILPAILSLLFSSYMRRKGWIKENDMLLGTR